jgi:hypothetical protein
MTPLREQLMRRLQRLGVEERPWPGRNGGLSSLLFNGKEFAHFHNDNELDIRLTRVVIAREGLQHPTETQAHRNRSRNSQWFVAQFSHAGDLDRVVDLVKLALERL